MKKEAVLAFLEMEGSMLMSRITIGFLICCTVIGVFMARPLQAHSIPAIMTDRVSMMKPDRTTDHPVETLVVFISRSTNSCATTLVINSDGSVISNQCNKLLLRVPSPSVVTKLFSDAAAAAPLSHLPQPQGCLKSPSFGTTTILVSHNQMSPDISCSRDTAGLTLYHDVYAIIATI